MSKHFIEKMLSVYFWLFPVLMTQNDLLIIKLASALKFVSVTDVFGIIGTVQTCTQFILNTKKSTDCC